MDEKKLFPKWRRFRHVDLEAYRLGLKPRFEYFERLVTREPDALKYNQLWQRANITREAREILLKQPFRAKLFRAPDTRETLGFCIIFDKFNAEFRKRYDQTPLIVAPKNARDEFRRQGTMRFTQRFLACEEDGRVWVDRALYEVESWYPGRAMWHAVYDEPYFRDTLPSRKPEPVPPVQPVVAEMLPEDVEALQNIDLDV